MAGARAAIAVGASKHNASGCINEADRDFCSVYRVGLKLFAPQLERTWAPKRCNVLIVRIATVHAIHVWSRVTRINTASGTLFGGIDGLTRGY